MPVKYWFALFLLAIIQVYSCGSIVDTSPNILCSKHFPQKPPDIDVNIGKSIRLSRRKRDLEDLRLLIDLERNPIFRGPNYRHLAPILSYDNPETSRGLYGNGGNLRRLATSEPANDQYKKVVVQKNRGPSDDTRKIAEQFGALQRMDLPDDIKSYIVNEYLNKIVFCDDNQNVPADTVKDNFYGIKTDVSTDKSNAEYIKALENYIRNAKIETDNIDYLPENSLQPGAISKMYADEILKNPYRKRMVDFGDLSEPMDKDIGLRDKLTSDNPLSKPSKVKLSTEGEIKEAKEPNEFSDAMNDNYKVIIDLRDRVAKGIEKNNLVKQTEDRKSVTNTNDIRIKIKKDPSTSSHNVEPPHTPPEIKIVIKLPEKKENVNQHDDKNDKNAENNGNEPKNNVREEIKNYISLALSLLREMEDGTENYTIDSDRKDYITVHQNF